MEDEIKRQEIANLVFPEEKEYTYYEEKYPKRNLKEGAVVTRFAPSPTGFVHIGGLYQCIFNTSLVRRSKGKMYLRIEDTDKEREVKDGVKLIVDTLKKFKIQFDEGPTGEGEQEIGDYGPYKQSKRGEIYRSYAKRLIEMRKSISLLFNKRRIR